MTSAPMRRRSFLTLLGASAAAWPVAARAQQGVMPVIGFLYTGSPEPAAPFAAVFLKGLSESGYVEGRNVAIEYRFAHSDYGRLPELAADLVRRRVAVIAAVGGLPPALAAKAATTTIPIVFRTGGDPVRSGLVASLNRPGGNVTGVTDMGLDLAPKRLGLLHDLLPGAKRIAVLFDPQASAVYDSIAELETAASTIGLQIEPLNASTNREIDAAFATFAQDRADALVVSAHVLFANRRVQIVTLATQHKVPTIYPNREYADIGGLMSYSANVADQWRQAGIYTGRILKGEKPADLPVMRATKFEFVLNLQTARTLGVEVPPQLLAIADEVIE